MSGVGNWDQGSTYRWRKLRAWVLRRDAYRCQIRLDCCTQLATQVHHTLGRSVTGDDSRYLVASCAPCNRRVGDPTRSNIKECEPKQVTQW